MKSPLVVKTPTETPAIFCDADVKTATRGLGIFGSVQDLLYASQGQQYAEYSAILVPLRQAVQVGGHTAAQAVDSQFIVLAMILHKDNRLTPSNADLFSIAPEWMPAYDTLVDIGAQVRALCMQISDGSSLLRIFEFALPGHKNNRLHFPLFREVDRHSMQCLVRLMLALCLGSCPTSERRPTLAARAKLLYLYWNLLNRANAADLHTFCIAHVAIAKLAVIEYFLYFSHSNHPVEVQFLFASSSEQTNNTAAAIFFHLDQFRQNSFASEDFDMSVGNTFAGQTMEKCTRLWKSRLSPSPLSSKSYNRRILCENELKLRDIDRRRISTLALQCPQATHPIYLKLSHNLSIADASSVCAMHKLINVVPLPRGLARKQLTAVQKQIQNSGQAVLKLLHIHVCMMCLIHKPLTALDRKMRINSDGRIFCSHCDECDTVAHINVLGRLVFVGKLCLYYCWASREVCVWQGEGSDLLRQETRAAAQPETNCRKCMLCERKGSAVDTLHGVLDEHIGVLNDLYLCNWHTPREAVQGLICNYDSLIELIRSKHAAVRERRR